MKTNLIALAFASVSLTSFAAFAQAPCHGHDGTPEFSNQDEPSRADGRYELQDTQQWVPSRYEQVTVQQCREARHGRWNRHWNNTVCFPVTESRLVPGHYESVQEWVFVSYPQREQYSSIPSQRPPPAYNQGRSGNGYGHR